MGAYASHKYLKTFADSAAHVRYIAFREREGKSESLGLFSAELDQADAEIFIKTLDAKRFQHSDVPNLHTVLFSMSGDEYNRSGFEDHDYKKMIRHVMKEWELKTGYQLSWVAAEHRNPDHPHVHVAIRAAYHDRNGIERRLKITNEDRRFFREQFQKAKELYRPFDPPPRELERYKEQSLMIDTTFIDNLFYQIDRELQQQEFDKEREKQKKQKQKGRDR